MSVTIKDLTSITTPADSAEVWIQDSTQSAPIDRRWSLTNLLAYLRGKFGTAVDSDVTTSATDTTAGRLLKVGDAGLLIATPTSVDDLTDIDDIPSGTLLRNSSASSSFASTFGFPHAGTLLSLPFSSARKTVFYTTVNAAVKSYIISATANNTYDIVELLHDGNYPSDSAWTSVTSLDNDWTGTVLYIKRAGFVTVSVAVNGSAKTDDTILTLPTSYRPGVTQFPSDNRSNNNSNILTSGSITSASSGTSVLFSATFPVI